MIQRSWKEKEILINALCAVCGYNLKWRLIYGGNREKTYRRIGQKRHRHAQ